MLKDNGRMVMQYTSDMKLKRAFIYIPISVVRDSQFPFKVNQDLTIVVNPKTKEIIVREKDFEV